MHQCKLIQFICALLVVTPLAAQATPLNMKAGQWEDVITTTTSGAQHLIPPEALKAMPPERRARIMNPPPMTMKVMHCVKESDTLESTFDQKEFKTDCQLKNLKKASTSYEVDVVCHKQGPNGRNIEINSHVKVNAESSEKVVSIADMQTSVGTKARTETRSHWIKAACDAPSAQGSKPR